jgi:Pretoxin HINT domain
LIVAGFSEGGLAGGATACLMTTICESTGAAAFCALNTICDGGFEGGATPVGCGGQSFTADTQVVSSSGEQVPVSSLKDGDTVESTNTATGKKEPQTVEDVMVNHDTDLYDLTVKTPHGLSVVHTTSGHLFWDATTKKWVQAASLHRGDRLMTADGTTATADGGAVPQVKTGWMWDLTIGNDHDFYVVAGDTPVLVHNCGSFTKEYPGGSTVMATVDADGAMEMAIQAEDGSTKGGQMFRDAMEALGPENVNSFEAKWVRAMPSNLDAFNANLRAGMSYEEAAANTFTGHMLAGYGLTDVTVDPSTLVGEFGNYTNAEPIFSRPTG